jgi:hypothetical protein
MSFGSLFRLPAPRGPARSCPPKRSPRQAGLPGGREPLGHPALRFPGFRPHGRERDLSGSPAIRPVALRRPKTPDDPSCLAMAAGRVLPPGPTHRRRRQDHDIGANPAASPPAVYASRVTLPPPMQDSLPAGGLRLCRAGVEPAGSLRTVSVHPSPPFLSHPPFRGLA